MVLVFAHLASAQTTSLVIGPGQEPLLSDMLGKGVALPGDCAWAGASVEQSRVLSRYTCAGAGIELELRHPTDGAGSLASTLRFGIWARPGAPPPLALVEALAARLRTREAEFAWHSVSPPPPGPVEGPPATRPSQLLLWLGAALALAALAVLTRLISRGPHRTSRWTADAWMIVVSLGLATALHGASESFGAVTSNEQATGVRVAAALATLSCIAFVLVAAASLWRLPSRLPRWALALAGLALYAALRWPLRDERTPPPDASPPRTPGVSCAGGPGANRSCGPGHDIDCCERRAVPGGTYARSFDRVNCTDSSFPATVSGFELDTFEVTVGRFRAFLAEGQGTQARPPPPGAGAHPRVPGSGWDPAWDRFLEPDRASLETHLRCTTDTANWTRDAGEAERSPINCVTFYEAFAFCARAGGRLPTEAEWNAAAAGGAEQRVFPWSTPPSSDQIDETRAVYSQPRAQAVGSKSPAGDGRWGHADLAGNVWEWTLDTADPGHLLPTEGADHCTPFGYPQPCLDCAALESGSGRVLRGGGYGMPARGLIASLRRASAPTARFHVFGLRCAYDLAPGRPAPQVGDATPSPACAPRCGGRSCGPDGCGGACGACPGGAPCDELGQCDSAGYPSGPRALARGAVIPNYSLQGFLDARVQGASMVPIRMSDFYNPTGAALYPAGSPLGAGKPRPRALLIHFAAAWSSSSRAEASVLGQRRQRDLARGGEVLTVLVDGERRGQAADSYGLVAWARENDLGALTLMDPHNLLAPSLKTFPANAVVDTRTMKIVELLEADQPSADGPWWRSWDALLTPAPP